LLAHLLSFMTKPSVSLSCHIRRVLRRSKCQKALFLCGVSRVCFLRYYASGRKFNYYRLRTTLWKWPKSFLR